MKHFNINSPVAPVHSEPKFQSEMVTQAILGESCSVLKYHKDWRYVAQSDGYEGWIHSFYGVDAENPYEATHTFFDLTGSSKDLKESRKIVYGSKCNLTNANKLIFPDGWEGSTPNGFQPTWFTASRNSILREGRKLLGVPYLWGGKSSLGIDCSGLIQIIFQSVGIKLPRDAWQQAEHFKSHKISMNSIQPGDILFFGDNKSITHTALSTGGFNFLHSQGWVKEESLDKFQSNYNEKCFQIFRFAVSVNHLLHQ